MKDETNPKIKEAITQKCMEYLKRAEEIRGILDNGGSGAAPNGDATIASQPKTKLKRGVGKDEEDPEQAKLRADLDSVINREKPNVKWSDVAKLESSKQALQETVILPVKFPQFFKLVSSSIIIFKFWANLLLVFLLNLGILSMRISLNCFMVTLDTYEY